MHCTRKVNVIRRFSITVCVFSLALPKDHCTIARIDVGIVTEEFDDLSLLLSKQIIKY